MTSMLVKVALAGAAALPLTWLRADDDKKSDDKKAEKRVEVKVLRLDGKDGDKPSVIVLSDGDDKTEKRAKVKVLRLDGSDGEKADVRVLLDDDDKPAAKTSYLGVVIEPVPAALATHLSDVLPKDTGLLIAQVADDSPAAKAGLKEHDILVSYGDEKLHSSEQLTKLVRGDKVGHEVTLGVVHAGKLEKVKVTIGEHETKAGSFAIPGKGRVLIDPHGDRKEAIRILKDREDKAAPGAKAGARSSFSSMRLESIDGDRFRAEIEYKNEKGDSLKRSFEGTREEIQKQIEADKEMPEAIRNQLQRSLGGKGAFRFNMPRGGFAFDLDSDDFPMFNWSGSGDFEKIFEQFSNQLDPELREKLKGAFRSIEEPQPHKKPVPRDGTL
jgi:PDZ domain